MRNGNDLILRHEIDLFDALLSEGVEIKTLDGETIKFRSEQIITPKTTKVFKGKGMPIYSDDPLAPLMMNHTRGNLVLKFSVKFPMMSAEQKEKLIAVLSADTL